MKSGNKTTLPGVRVRGGSASRDRLKVGRPRRAEYDQFAGSLLAWYADGGGSGEISIGPFWNAQDLLRFRMGFPRSLAFGELPSKLTARLRTRLSADRRTIYYYTRNKKEA